MKIRLISLCLLFPAVAHAEANGLIVLIAIAGIPLLLCIIAIVVLASSSPFKKKQFDFDEGEASKTNAISIAKNIVLKTISVAMYIILIYLSFLPIQIFPNSKGVLVVNVIVVLTIIIVKIKQYIEAKK